MLRDFKSLRRDSGKHTEEIENVPLNSRDSLSSQASADSSRPPLHTIQDPAHSANPHFEQDAKIARTKIERTPTKPKPSSGLPLRTPDKHGGLPFVGKRHGWAQRTEPCSATSELRDEATRGGAPNLTPRSTRTMGRANSTCSDANSAQNTPTKSVSKPPSYGGFRGKGDGSNASCRVGNYAALYRGIPASGGSSTTVVNSVEVPHFDLKENPSFWMDHNVQVVIRVRPLNSMEKGTNGYNRCLKQESDQSITWIGQPETRFTFDHVACETVDQEMLFRVACLPMVENCLSGYNSCMFAYGQTGSGKTYTMLGEINDLEVKPSTHRGMTPRIFEFLFARIQAEEESRRDERLKYYCKCSFLEIYNEQITDLLDPSSTNLLLREDTKQGVYVENLSEFEVHTVSDIVKLLTQGSLNRKVAATNMNRESSRSHSVFTCVIESRWEKDSTTNLRFARLNLVDLAGSERQKSSGAEGDRLKEAANINKSLSTLGHVIMILVDVANGRTRHIPYRDSRLTFLLQDSLGGNSKTMIIANVSPSICCTAETLNTLKFAQRAKLIQNNAVVNEDSTGDIVALQHQIRLLKEELSLLKRQNVSRTLSFGSTIKNTNQLHDATCTENMYETDDQQAEGLLEFESKGIVRMSTKQLKSLETTLAGALRREQMAENCIKKLEAEIEHLNRLVRQREDGTRSSKMMLRFREDKIHRMESLVAGSLPQEAYLLEENKALQEEVHLLQSKVDTNPEVTRFAFENIRLLEQLRRYQDFYEEGEREILMEEVSKLREQLLHHFDGKLTQHNSPNLNDQPQEVQNINDEGNPLHLELENTLNELEDCRNKLNSCLDENQKLCREINDLKNILESLKSTKQCADGDVKTTEAQTSELGSQEAVQNELKSTYSEMKHAEEILNLELEVDIYKTVLNEGRLSRNELEERTKCLSRELELERGRLMLVSKQYEDTIHELKETKSVIEALESEQVLAINGMEDLRKSNTHYVELLSEKELEIITLKEQLSKRELNDFSSTHSVGEESILPRKLKRMQDSLEKAKRLNIWYQNDRTFQANNVEEMDEVRRQAEAETAEVIVCMQEELSILQQQVHDYHLKETDTKNGMMVLEAEMKELQGQLHLLTEDNQNLHEQLEGKDGELRKLSEEWEFLVSEMLQVLADGEEALTDASDQIDLISSSFPHKRIWISEQVSRLIRIITEKELLIEELGNCLEDAYNKRSDVDCMLKSLRGAALVINEAHQQECCEKEEEITILKSLLKEKTSTIAELEDKKKLVEQHASKAAICATVAFVIVSRLSEMNTDNLDELKFKDAQLNESTEINQRKDALIKDQSTAIEEADVESQSLRLELAVLKEMHAELQEKLFLEEERANGMGLKLAALEESDMLETREKLNELKTGVSSLRSCMSISSKHEHSTGINERTDAEGYSSGDAPKFSPESVKNLNATSCGKTSKELKRTSKDVCDRDATIILLKNEIESALESLKEVQQQMAKLHMEKEEIQISEKHSQQRLKCFTTDILALQEAMSILDNQFELKWSNLNQKIQASERNIQEAKTEWRQTKEFLEMEVGDAQLVAAQKTAEASCVFAKFEEAQDTMREADIMINELMIAKETLKLDVERLKGKQTALVNDRSMLTDEVKILQSVNCIKEQQVEDLEKQFGMSLMEINDLVVGLEGIIAQFQSSFTEDFMSLVNDFQYIKGLFLDSGNLVRSWLEDIWSEIIVKDCAVSVLHLCHMGILLETVTGLNAENGLLQYGLCESNASLADLREHNFKSNRELQMCRTLKGKLLVDIKSSYDRVLRKEEETGELTSKLTNFDKKISDLEQQEELMLQRSNYMGSQLSLLMKDLDFSNRNTTESLFDQEKKLKRNGELLNSQSELFMVDSFSKDIESLVLVSQLEEMSLDRDATNREYTSCVSILEILKEQMILLMVDGGMQEEVSVVKDAEVDLLQKEVEKMINDLNASETALQSSSSHFSAVDQQNQKLQNDISLLETSVNTLRSELDSKNAELGRIRCWEEENEALRGEVLKFKTENSLVLKDLENKNSEMHSALRSMTLSDMEVHKLQDRILHLEIDMRMKNAEVDELRHSQSVVTADLRTKSQDLELLVDKVNNTSGKEIVLLRNELASYKKVLHEALTRLIIDSKRCSGSVENVGTTGNNLFNLLEKESRIVEKMFYEICGAVDRTSAYIEELECLECCAKELVSENMNLQTELLRKDDILKGLQFDLSLLQESASNTMDQKDKVENMMALLEDLEDELVLKSEGLEEAVARSQTLEAQLKEKMGIVSALELKLVKESESLKKSSSENQELRSQIGEVLAAKSFLEEELTEKRNLAESLEIELSQMVDTVGEMNRTIESLRNDVDELTSERDELCTEMQTLKEQIGNAQAWAEENEAIAMEAQEVAESRKIYAEEKEAEVQLLERSIEELECTVNALEDKADILKEEAERQRLQREELEMELQSVKHQMQNVKSPDTDMKRHLDEKEKQYDEVMKQLQDLEKNLAEKDAEIVQCKNHISELNLHAEAQASEYKQKFKALEVMAEQVRPEGNFSSIATSSSNKLEKNSAKSRGSGSPFKCIGIGLAQQIKSEKDEELTSARFRIEELECLAASRQKEIFALNARLASAESMTHDVIRDLLGVKLDMTSFMSLLDNQQLQKIAEKVQLNSSDPESKAQQEIVKLKQQLNGFIEERRGWLEEIARKQAEMVAAQIALEKLRQRDQLLKTENEMLKMENANNKKRAMELEDEVKKLSGQQNLHQRIHHHAKIKEENNMLKLQNDDLTAKLKRTEIILSRVKEELAHYRTSIGKRPLVDFDKEQQLMTELREIDDDRMQISQKLLSLCTSILKAAGITRPESKISPSVAEEALDKMKNRISSLERECQDLAFKNRITKEKMRLGELMPEASSPPRMSSRMDENRQTPPRRSQTPFFSALDR
ncbi:phragmoplast orienting kinesin 2 [Euphorbia peplus]|nr:phragmoplast orienting kinesin 2 [Euphorbia peplus]